MEHDDVIVESNLPVKGSTMSIITNAEVFDTMISFAGKLVKTNFLPTSIKTAEQAVAIILTGQEMGLLPMQSLRQIHIICGKPTLAASLQLALFLKRGGIYQWIESNHEKAVLKLKNAQGVEHTETFTIDDAKRAKLLGNDIWIKYPKQMLRARCASGGITAIDPSSNMGMYDPEEMQSVVDAEYTVESEGKGKTTRRKKHPDPPSPSSPETEHEPPPPEPDPLTELPPPVRRLTDALRDRISNSDNWVKLYDWWEQDKHLFATGAQTEIDGLIKARKSVINTDVPEFQHTESTDLDEPFQGEPDTKPADPIETLQKLGESYREEVSEAESDKVSVEQMLNLIDNAKGKEELDTCLKMFNMYESGFIPIGRKAVVNAIADKREELKPKAKPASELFNPSNAQENNMAVLLAEIKDCRNMEDNKAFQEKFKEIQESFTLNERREINNSIVQNRSIISKLEDK